RAAARGPGGDRRAARCGRTGRAEARRARAQVRHHRRPQPAVGRPRHHGVVIMPSDVNDLTRAVRVLRDEVLDTVRHGDRDPPGAELFEALVRSLSVGGNAGSDIDLALHDSVARRLAWGDSEESVLADAEQVFDRLLVSIERALRDSADQI